VIEERFAQGNSFLHKRDPRGKILAAFCFTTVVALLDAPAIILAAFLLSLFLLISAKLDFRATVKRIALVNGFTLFLWVSLPLSYGGTDYYHLGPLTLSVQGVNLAALITLKTNTIIPAIIALLATSTVADLGHALYRLRCPLKLVFILLYSYRYVFVIHQEYNRLLRAAKMRAFSPKTNLHTYKTFAYLFGMTLVKSYNRSHKVHQAMLLRGFNGRLVSLHQHVFNLTDIAFISIIIIFSTGLVLISLL